MQNEHVVCYPRDRLHCTNAVLHAHTQCVSLIWHKHHILNRINIWLKAACKERLGGLLELELKRRKNSIVQSKRETLKSFYFCELHRLCWDCVSVSILYGTSYVGCLFDSRRWVCAWVWFVKFFFHILYLPFFFFILFHFCIAHILSFPQSL